MIDVMTDEGEWSVYIIQCHDGSLYAGVTTCVERRVAEHRNGTGRGAKYLRGKGPLTLVLNQTVGSHGQALRVEHVIKGLRRHEKDILIENPHLIEHLL